MDNKDLEVLLSKITDKEVRQKINYFFSNEVSLFNQKMDEVDDRLTKGTLNKKEGCSIVAADIVKIMKKGHELEELIKDRALVKKIKQVFRESVMQSFIKKSYLVNWGFSKPSGFPGDFKLIEMLYDNAPRSEGIGYCGDSYILQDSYVEAVRIRKDLMKKLLLNFINENNKKTLSILNVGCGSGREVKELLSAAPFKEEVVFSLLDWDKEALEFNQAAFQAMQQKSNSSSFKYFNMNVMEFYRYPEKNIKLLGGQDLVYSIGLADYLTNAVLGEVVKFCFELLHKSGQIMIAHKNVKVHDSLASDWFCDWYFYPRNQEDMKRIIEEAVSNEKCEIKFIEEETQHIFFAIVTKK